MIKSVRKKKQELEPGAVYAVPLPKGGYAYLKLLFQAPWRDVAKLYNVQSEAVLPVADVVAAGTLVERVIVAGSGIQSGDWPRIGFEDIGPDEDLTESLFLMGLPPNQQVRSLKDNSFIRPPTNQDIEELPQARIHNQYHFEEILSKHRE